VKATLEAHSLEKNAPPHNLRKRMTVTLRELLQLLWDDLGHSFAGGHVGQVRVRSY
jgi:hypothetical protein